MEVVLVLSIIEVKGEENEAISLFHGDGFKNIPIVIFFSQCREEKKATSIYLNHSMLSE